MPNMIRMNNMTNMNNQTSTSRRRTTKVVSAIALIAMAGVSGCSKSDDAQAAVKEAGRSFSVIAAGDSTATPSYSATAYRETEALVSEFAGSEDGYAEAAAITLGLSRLGQASLASIDASKTETQSLQQARVIRGMLNEWLTMDAISKAAGLFDPSAELAEIEMLLALRQDDIASYTAERDTIDAKIADLDTQINDLRTKSSNERNQAGALDLQIAQVNAMRAAEIVVRVREHTLRADGYKLEAIRIEGVAAQLRPSATETELNVNKASSQVALLKDARDELNERDVSSQNDARQARDAASASAKMIEEAVANYTEFRENEVVSANDKATSLIRSSLSAFRDANSVTKQIASLSKASAQQTLAECYARQANGYAEAAILYNAIDEAGLAGNWASMAQAAAQSQVETDELTNEAYQGAASALRRAGIRGDEGEKIEATAVRLDQLGGVEPEPEYEETYEEDSQLDDEFAEDETDPDSEG